MQTEHGPSVPGARGLNPQTAREALILEALGGIDQILLRSEEVAARLALEVDKLQSAAGALHAGGEQYATQLATLTAATKGALVEYIEQRAARITTVALETHRKNMQDAATLAFADQLAPMVRDIARQLEQHSLARSTAASRWTRWSCGLAGFLAGAGVCALAAWMGWYR